MYLFVVSKRVLMILSKVFPSVGASVIGLYDDGGERSLLAFGMTLMIEILKVWGMYAVCIIALYRSISRSIADADACLMCSCVIISGPGALLFLCVSKMVASSCCVTCWVRTCVCIFVCMC